MVDSLVFGENGAEPVQGRPRVSGWLGVQGGSGFGVGSGSRVAQSHRASGLVRGGLRVVRGGGLRVVVRDGSGWFRVVRGGSGSGVVQGPGLVQGWFGVVLSSDFVYEIVYRRSARAGSGRLRVSGLRSQGGSGVRTQRFSKGWMIEDEWLRMSVSVGFQVGFRVAEGISCALRELLCPNLGLKTENAPLIACSERRVYYRRGTIFYHLEPI